MESRQLRKRKELPVSYTPVIMDDIFVCWDVSGTTFWWPATIIEVREFDKSKGSKYGEGRLLYKRYKSYEPEEADVEFFYTQRKGRVLVQQYNGSMLEMSWSQQPPSAASSTKKVEDSTTPQQSRLQDDDNRRVQRQQKTRKVEGAVAQLPTTEQVDTVDPDPDKVTTLGVRKAKRT